MNPFRQAITLTSEIDSLESIAGLLKCLRIRAQVPYTVCCRRRFRRGVQ
jgi:hypothetical protein